MGCSEGCGAGRPTEKCAGGAEQTRGDIQLRPTHFQISYTFRINTEYFNLIEEMF